jgi:hypothetical protein
MEQHHQGSGPPAGDGRPFTPGSLTLAYAPGVDSGPGGVPFTGLVHPQAHPYMQPEGHHHQLTGYPALHQLPYSDAPLVAAPFGHVPSFGQLGQFWGQTSGWSGGTHVIIQPAAAAVIYPVHVIHPMQVAHLQHPSSGHYSSSSNAGAAAGCSGGSRAGSETGMSSSYAMPPPTTPTPPPPAPAGYSSGGYGDRQPQAAGGGGGGSGSGGSSSGPSHGRAAAAMGSAAAHHSQRLPPSGGVSRSNSSQPNSWVASECSNSIGTASTDLDTASLGCEMQSSVAGCSSVASGSMVWGSARQPPVLPDAIQNQSWAWLVEGILQQIMQVSLGRGGRGGLLGRVCVCVGGGGGKTKGGCG